MWRTASRLFFSMQKFDPKKDYYKILLLNQKATSDQIKKSFRQLAKKYHPDSKTGKEEIFKEINEANQVLSSEEIRKQYDQNRRVNRVNVNHQNQQKNPNSQKYYNQNQRYERKRPSPEYQYDEQNPEKFRQYIRKQHEQQMKKYTQQRQNYDNLGRGYQNYDRFHEQALKKKKQKFQQKVKITQQSVKQQQQTYRKYSEQKSQQQRDKLKQNVKNDLLNRYNRAILNSEKTIQGIKQMGSILKDLFKKR